MFFSFIQANYKWIIAAIYALILLVIVILKKKVKIIDVVKTIISEVLPDCIIQAETKFGAGNGDEKKAYVIQLICKTISERFGIDEFEVFKLYRPFIESMLENILSTPKKK